VQKIIGVTKFRQNLARPRQQSWRAPGHLPAAGRQDIKLKVTSKKKKAKQKRR
jgi:hypothetical protein